MALTPLKYTPLRNGLWVPPGLWALKTKDDDFSAGSMPSWLTATAGTASYGTLPASCPLTITSAAGASQVARLAGASTFTTTVWAGMLWELDGLKFSTGTASIAIGITGSSSSGIYLRQLDTEDVPYLRWGGGAGQQTVNLALRGNATGVRNLKLVYDFRRKSAYVYSNDQCVGAIEDASAITEGAVSPSVSITSTSSASTAVSLSVMRARMTVWGNAV